MANSKTVIIIDDDPDVLEATRSILEGADYTVVTALSAEEGLAHVRQGGIDCIILDVMMATDTEGCAIYPAVAHVPFAPDDL